LTPDQRSLLAHTRDSIAAAQLLASQGYYSFAGSRAYYAMFYIAEAFLLGQDLTFSKHSAVIAAFGKHFAKPGLVPPEFHRYLIEGQDVRNAADYGRGKKLTAEQAAEQIGRAEQFLDLATSFIGG